MITVTYSNNTYTTYDSINGISKPEEVIKLDCSRKRLTSLEVLSKFTSLQELDCSHNYILTSLKGLENCTQLIYLNCQDTKLESLEGLENCTQLITLNCDRTKLRNFRGLKNCTKLRVILCNEARLATLHGIHNCMDLEVIHCRKNFLNDLRIPGNDGSVSGMEIFTKLKSINFSHNLITSLEGIKNCTSIEDMDYSYNKFEPIEDKQNWPLFKERNDMYEKITGLSPELPFGF